jgi:hypothetical protein
MTFSSPASLDKAQREVAECRRFRELGELLEVNEQICRLRPVTEAAPSDLGKKAAQAIRQQVTREIDQLFSFVFNGRRRTLLPDLAAGGARGDAPCRPATLSELLHFAAPATEEERTVACACGPHTRYMKLRSKPVLTVVGQARVSRPYDQCPDCHQGQFPVDVERDIENTEFSPGARRMHALAGLMGLDAPFDHDECAPSKPGNREDYKLPEMEKRNDMFPPFLRVNSVCGLLASTYAPPWSCSELLQCQPKIEQTVCVRLVNEFYRQFAIRVRHLFIRVDHQPAYQLNAQIGKSKWRADLAVGAFNLRVIYLSLSVAKEGNIGDAVIRPVKAVYERELALHRISVAVDYSGDPFELMPVVGRSKMQKAQNVDCVLTVLEEGVGALVSGNLAGVIGCRCRHGHQPCNQERSHYEVQQPLHSGE